MDESTLRKKAIEMYLQSKSPSLICQELGKSRPWFYKWLKRYQADPAGQWFVEESRRPHTIHSKISPEMAELVINTRKQLEKTPYAQIGAVSIQWEIKKLGLEPPPVWTIDRLLKKRDLAKPKKKERKRTNEYPGTGYPNVQQMDLVGPRYIKDFGRFYSLNIIDIDTHCAQINPIASKAADGIVAAVIRFWQHYGIPDYLQMDNELSFRGSNRHPHSFGKLIRFCFSHGVCPIFIPLAEPWRNGVIERFNDTFEKKFYRSQFFKDLDDMRKKAPDFEAFHNTYHRYSAHNNRTPKEMFRANKPIAFLAQDYELPERLPLEEGEIILFRFIRSNRKLDIFGESFTVDKNLVYSYVKALINVEAQALKIYQDEKLIQEFYYPMPVDW